MDDKTISSVCKQVYLKFPEVRGVKPKVKAQPGDHTLLVFQGKSTTASGQSMPCTVRVTVASNGHITKMSSSR